MRKFACLIFLVSSMAFGQNMTPELLWSLGRVSPIGLTDDNMYLLYKVSTPDMDGNTITSKNYLYDITLGGLLEVKETEQWRTDPKLSPDGKYKILTEQVKLDSVIGLDIYPELDKSNALIYDGLQHRHWDTWADGKYNHIIIQRLDSTGKKTDIMAGEPYHCPTMPFGGSEDYTWTPDGKGVIYVAKKKSGTAYMNSTNTDLYRYDVETGETKNLTADNPGYDTHPVFSPAGQLAWLSMARDGYEADKNDIKVVINDKVANLTAEWDGTADGFIWGNDGKMIYFTAPVNGTKQVFSIEVPGRAGKAPEVVQITEGQWDVTSLVGQVGNRLIASRTDMNRAAEIYSIDLKDGKMTQITTVNDAAYKKIGKSKVEARMIPTTDGKEMLAWVIYPPDFDASKKYPTLLYAQGGPQSPLSQFYSFRWNFQVMAAQGYIVIAPNRRGMQGHGVEWNEQISGDWGGQNMQDYLSAIDHIAEEPYVDKDRLGCVGASYGGYSAFYLAGIHEGRFKTFIAHDGIFNLRSMYGTTEELFFTHWD
jgi:dipeptidyl aminopeptidase/acylaminoacyl peptidase